MCSKYRIGLINSLDLSNKRIFDYRKFKMICINLGWLFIGLK